MGGALAGCSIETDPPTDPPVTPETCVATSVTPAFGASGVGKSTLLNGILGDDRFVTGPEAGITRDSGDVSFADGTAPVGETETWVFYVIDGTAEEAVSLARAVNERRALSR